MPLFVFSVQTRSKPMSMRDMKRQSASRHEQPPSYSQSQHNRPRPASAYEPGRQPDRVSEE